MKLIQTITLTSNAASVEFASIPQTFTDLVLISSVRTVSTDAVNDFGVSLGGTMTNRRLEGNGSTAYSSSNTGYNMIGISNTSISTANTFANNISYFPNYTSSTAKSVSSDGVTENNATQAHAGFYAAFSTSTSPITTIAAGAGSNLVAGSTFSLYGILKGSDGIVTTSP